MASNLTKVNALRALQVRGYAHAVPLSGIAGVEVKSSTLPNKLVVAAAENNSPICRISIQVKAGSRNETPDNVGVAHVLRNCAGLSTANSTQFSITRHVQQVGASLYCSATREKIGYVLEGTREAVEETLPFLTEVATKQVFKPWEVSDNIPRLRLELTTRPPQQRAIDLLHKAAYRQGLGNSLYIAKYNLEKISTETLQHYVASNFKSARAAVIGLGVDYAALSQYASSLELETGQGQSDSCSYKGGEIRSDKGGNYAFVAIATEGAASTNEKEALAFGILQKVWGDGPCVQWGNNSNGLLSNAAGHGNFGLSALNINYSDSGLFGAMIASEADDAGKLVDAAIKTIKSGNITDEHVNRGKNQLKLQILLKAENGADSIDSLAKQALFKGSASNLNDVISALDSITTSDVKAAASKVASGKLSIAAVGNLRKVPFLDQI